jgi:protein TonB
MRTTAVFALILCTALLQPQRILAQGESEPSPCPSAVPGTPEPEWFKGTVRPGPGVTNPTLLKSARPQYTPEAEAAGITGEVWLDARVDADGRVRNVCLVRSLPMLDAQAAKAAKEFEFRPAQQNGAPIPVIVRIQIAFNLREKK